MNDFSLPQFEQILNFFLLHLFLSFDFCFFLCCCCWWWWLCRLSSFDSTCPIHESAWRCPGVSFILQLSRCLFSLFLVSLSLSSLDDNQFFFITKLHSSNGDRTGRDGRALAMKTQKFALYSFPSFLSAFKTSVCLSVRLLLTGWSSWTSDAAGFSSVSLFINQLSNLATTNGTRCA